MENRVKFGLLGRNISYSFSQNYFSEKFQKLSLVNHTYELFDISDLDCLSDILSDTQLRGLNVTIPYKEKIISFLDELSNEAKAVGAVNTVKITDGRLVGYNTDVFGFEKTLLLHKKKRSQKAIILGDGGAAKAVKFVLKKHDIPFMVVSRKSPELNFGHLSKEKIYGYEIIIQCTPVGTFPNVEDCLYFPFEALTTSHLVIDLIYNPSQTRFMKNASKNGARCVNGYYMLEQQAEKSWEIWNY